MKGSENLLLSFMDGHDKRFIIPVYQRNYDWKIKNCKQLFDDLVKMINTGRKAHFFGSIVYVYDYDGDSSKHEYLIIDGQQRLTTVSLLLLAMYNLLRSGVVVSQFDSRAEEIYNEYLIDKYASDEKRIKLKPVKNDNNAFCKLFSDEDYYENSNLTINYRYFYNRIQKEEISIDDLYKAVSRLQIISIELNREDNPQLIFESLNSTGLALTEGDKIRNFVLMSQTKKLQNELYEKYWNPIEIATNYDVSMFIRDYLSVKIQHTPAINSVYETFKEYATDSNISIKCLLEDLFRYAKFYEILLKAKSSYAQLNNKLNKKYASQLNASIGWRQRLQDRSFWKFFVCSLKTRLH